MGYMFHKAKRFNQDLGWCVDANVDLEYAFDGTRCKSTSCGIETEEFGTCDEGIQAVFISGIVWACLVVLYCIITHWLNFEGSSEEGEKICTFLIFLPVLLVLSCVQFFCWFWWVSKNDNRGKFSGKRTNKTAAFNKNSLSCPSSLSSPASTSSGGCLLRRERAARSRPRRSMPRPRRPRNQPSLWAPWKR
jgi:hypothetical protein